MFYTLYYFSAIGLASRRYSLNCSSEQSVATPCASTSSRALGQNDFRRPKAWLTYVVEASVTKLRTFCEALRSRSSRGSPVCCAVFQRIHHFNQLSDGHPQVLQLFLALFLLFAQRLDLLKATGELLLSIGDHVLQLLDVICTTMQLILHISK
jgi:hypothetical protein